MDKIIDIEEAILEETDKITGLVPATQEAVDLPACEVHNFTFLRSAKTKEKVKGPGNKVSYRRSDTFYCRHCLRYTMMDRQEESTIMPNWFRDDR